MQEHSVNFLFTARYFKLGSITPDTRHIWIVLHGYGQLARYFIKKFNALDDGQTCVLAPEGLSRFYVEDIATRMHTGSTRVGATWMTRENRLMDIGNYMEYLTAIYEAEVKPQVHVPVTILGFSQGAATASRWILDNRIQFTRLILWAGIVPHDMDFIQGQTVLSKKEFLLVYGDQDPYLNTERLNELNVLTKKLGVEPTLISFHGGHDIDEKTLLTLSSPS